MKTKKACTILVILTSLLILVGLSRAADYPSKTITLVVPYPAGGPVDIIARIISNVAEKHIGQKMVVDVRPGSGGAIGSNYVAHAKADGYTLLLGGIGNNVVIPQMQNVGYAGKDFIGIAQVSQNTFLFAVKADSPYKKFEDFISAAKKGDATYSAGATGTSIHIASLMVFERAGVKPTFVPFKGSADALTSLMGGHIQAGMDWFSTYLPYVMSGAIRPLVTFESKRNPILPSVPTLKERGIDLSPVSWIAIFAPAKTPQAVVDKLRTATQKVASDPVFIEQMNKTGSPVYYVDGPEFRKTFDEDYQGYGEILTKYGMKK